MRTTRVGILLAVATGLAASLLQAQQRPNSPVLKSYVPSDKHSLVVPSDLTYELWQDFLLVKKANEGDPVAQHELGIRYLSGKGFSSDTVKAAYWIIKAAERGLPSARYNLGILENNGWGLPWNPFEAFRNIAFAAARGMPEAEYAMGLWYLDNLIVPRDERQAYCYVAAAADSHYVPAEEALKIFAERGIGKREAKAPQTGKSSSSTAAARVMFLDFDRDTSTRVPDTALVGEVVRDGSPRLREMADTTHDAPDSSAFADLIRAAAEAGSPEALTILGRWYETGTHVGRDVVTASLYYLRALRFDSPRAPTLLWNLTRDPGYFETLKRRVDRHDASAGTVWASLDALQLDNQLTEAQAVAMLESAAGENDPAALNELGFWYVQGIMVPKDRSRGIALWNKAKALGSREAAIRIAVTGIMSLEDSDKATGTVALLSRAMEEGSVLAQVAIGFCREHGLGLEQNTAEAARLYRKSAERGSLIGFDALKRMYDSLRPDDVEFQISE